MNPVIAARLTQGRAQEINAMIRSILVAAALVTFSVNCPAPNGIVAGHGVIIRPEPPSRGIAVGPLSGSLWDYLFCL
jgi:hypothetical protein